MMITSRLTIEPPAMTNEPVDIEKQVSGLTAAVSQLSESVSQLAQVSTRNESDISGLTNALGAVVTEFVRPTAKQAYKNQRAIAQLIERGERYQDWLDEDRHDINALRQETSSQIQSLIEEARADRQAANDRFEAVQSEIRQNQRLILAQGERLDKQGERLDIVLSENRALLSEVLSLSRRVTAVEDAA